MESVLEKDTHIKTDKWRGYQPLKNVFQNLEQINSGKKGNNFPELHRTIMGFKGWLRGMHHQVENLQAYIDEYCYRFNRSFMKDGIFDNLLLRMVKSPPFINNLAID